MKLITICIALLLIATTSSSQQISPTQTTAKQDYLQKSKNQRTTAWILVGGGVLLEISGAIAYQRGPAGLFLFGAGMLSQAVSIPFFISAAINKKKAKKASISFKLENVPDIRTHMACFRTNPAISLKLNL